MEQPRHIKGLAGISDEKIKEYQKKDSGMLEAREYAKKLNSNDIVFCTQDKVDNYLRWRPVPKTIDLRDLRRVIEGCVVSMCTDKNFNTIRQEQKNNKQLITKQQEALITQIFNNTVFRLNSEKRSVINSFNRKRSNKKSTGRRQSRRTNRNYRKGSRTIKVRRSTNRSRRYNKNSK
jgi:hypothetical protein